MENIMHMAVGNTRVPLGDVRAIEKMRVLVVVSTIVFIITKRDEVRGKWAVLKDKPEHKGRDCPTFAKDIETLLELARYAGAVSDSEQYLDFDSDMAMSLLQHAQENKGASIDHGVIDADWMEINMPNGMAAYDPATAGAIKLVAHSNGGKHTAGDALDIKNNLDKSSKVMELALEGKERDHWLAMAGGYRTMCLHAIERGEPIRLGA